MRGGVGPQRSVGSGAAARFDDEERLRSAQVGTVGMTLQIAQGLMERRRGAAFDGEPELLSFELAGELIRAERARNTFEACLEPLNAHRARQQETIGRYLEEVKRLGAILDQIYHSRSWRIHLFAEKLRQLGQ